MNNFISKISLDFLQNEKFSIWILILIWAALQIIAAIIFEMRFSVDSELYIENAIQIAKGKIPSGREFFYSGYSLLISLAILLNIDPLYTIFFHLISAVAAIICTYKITQLLSKSNTTAFIAALLYVLWIKFQQWNLILYTDALFANLVVVSTYLLFTANKAPQVLFALLLVLFTTLIRPTGIGFLFSIIVYKTYTFVKNRELKFITSLMVISLAMLILIFSLNFFLGFFIDSFIESYTRAEIIYPNISLFIDSPDSLIIPDQNHKPLVRLLFFIVQNPVYFIKITTIKGLLFIGHIKPYYSFFHNMFIILFLYPVYFLAVKGYKLLPAKNIKLFFMAFIGFHFLTISFTSENWDGRFVLQILPPIFILSAFGIKDVLKNKIIRKDKELSAHL